MTRSRELLYPLFGAVLALGAPAGLVVMRMLERRDGSLGGIVSDLVTDAATYGYSMVSATLAFGLLGLVLGKLTDRLADASGTDALTRLANRRRFDERFAVELARARRHGSPLSLLLVDVDKLKQINDAGGHQAGDAALRHVASALDASVRATDLAARWGGDEFSVLLPGVDATSAVELAKRIRRVLSTAPRVGAEPSVTVSIGITDTSLSGSDSPARLCAAADDALYAAKAAGRDRARVSLPPGSARR